MSQKENNDNKELLFSLVPGRDFIFETYKASGAGGQHRNKRETAIRLKHPASGVTVISAGQRSQAQNKKAAFKQLMEHKDFKRWLNRHAAIVMEGYRNVEHKVEDMMREENLRIEYYDPDDNNEG